MDQEEEERPPTPNLHQPSAPNPQAPHPRGPNTHASHPRTFSNLRAPRPRFPLNTGHSWHTQFNSYPSWNAPFYPRWHSPNFPYWHAPFCPHRDAPFYPHRDAPYDHHQPITNGTGVFIPRNVNQHGPSRVPYPQPETPSQVPRLALPALYSRPHTAFQEPCLSLSMPDPLPQTPSQAPRLPSHVPSSWPYHPLQDQRLAPYLLNPWRPQTPLHLPHPHPRAIPDQVPHAWQLYSWQLYSWQLYSWQLYSWHLYSWRLYSWQLSSWLLENMDYFLIEPQPEETPFWFIIRISHCVAMFLLNSIHGHIIIEGVYLFVYPVPVHLLLPPEDVFNEVGMQLPDDAQSYTTTDLLSGPENSMSSSSQSCAFLLLFKEFSKY